MDLILYQNVLHFNSFMVSSNTTQIRPENIPVSKMKSGICKEDPSRKRTTLVGSITTFYLSCGTKRKKDTSQTRKWFSTSASPPWKEAAVSLSSFTYEVKQVSEVWLLFVTLVANWLSLLKAHERMNKTLMSITVATVW